MAADWGVSVRRPLPVRPWVLGAPTRDPTPALQDRDLQDGSLGRSLPLRPQVPFPSLSHRPGEVAAASLISDHHYRNEIILSLEENELAEGFSLISLLIIIIIIIDPTSLILGFN